MDAKQALTDLAEISSQIRAAVLMGEAGTIAASTLDDERAKQMAEAARELLAAAERSRPGLGPVALTQLEAATIGGSVFVVRDRERVIAAVTGPEPTVGLVFYDLKTCLRNAAEAPARPKRAPAKKKPAAERPVRAKPEPVEGAQGNREVPPASEEESARPATRRRTTKKQEDAET